MIKRFDIDKYEDLCHANTPNTRFHAWQSALLFTAIMILHLIFAWSTFLSWVFFICDLCLIAFLTLKAYRDAEILDRYSVPKTQTPSSSPSQSGQMLTRAA